jgi:hypothetical protein
MMTIASDMTPTGLISGYDLAMFWELTQWMKSAKNSPVALLDPPRYSSLARAK